MITDWSAGIAAGTMLFLLIVYAFMFGAEETKQWMARRCTNFGRVEIGGAWYSCRKGGK